MPLKEGEVFPGSLLPSPAALVGKILIKGKRPNPKKEIQTHEEEEEEGT